MTIENKKKSPYIYGVTDHSKAPFSTLLNDWIIDNSWVTSKEKSLFFQSLQLLVVSGVRLSRALKILAEKTRNPRLKRIIHTIDYDLNHNGMSLSNAMAKYPRVFSSSETKMILSGEISGRLEDVLGYITNQMQKNLKLKTQIKSAMVYPATIFVGIILAIGVVTYWVIPQFKGMFDDFGAELPLSTRVMISVSDFSVQYWWLVLSGLIASWLFFQNWKQSPEGKYQWDNFTLTLPGLNKLIRNYQTIQITTNFATLISAGIPIIKALQILRQIIDNAVTKGALHQVEKSVRSGEPIHQAFGNNVYFDPVIAEVIEIGEQSGAMQTILLKTGQQYELEFDADMQNIAKLIEPVVLIIVAAVIVFMGMAIMTPILQLQQIFSG